MNFTPRKVGASALPEVIDLLLADIAIRVQLSKTDYDKAVARFGVMQEWIDRTGSPLRGLVNLMYPQGSMAIGSTVARASDRDEYDIDVVVALSIHRESDPEVVLNALHTAIRGQLGSRYYDKAIRHTRCVCVSYEDGMHIDLTPAVLVPELTARTSIIFHSKVENPAEPKVRLLANPYGLAEWFNAMTPVEADFADLYEARAIAFDKAMAEPVPDQEPAYRKSRALISLQLIKRWRNVLFSKPGRSNLRRPPSVLLSKLTADNANRTKTLSEELEYQACQMMMRLKAEKAHSRLIHEVNPCCATDILTDRWPRDHADQDLMIADLGDLVAKLQLLRTGNLSIEKIQTVLEGLFGERPAKSAVNDYMFSPQRNRVQYGTGRIVRGAVGASAALSQSVAAHSFYGADW